MEEAVSDQCQRAAEKETELLPWFGGLLKKGLVPFDRLKVSGKVQ